MIEIIPGWTSYVNRVKVLRVTDHNTVHLADGTWVFSSECYVLYREPVLKSINHAYDHKVYALGDNSDLPKEPVYEYQTINISLEPKQNPDDRFEKPSIASAANRWGAMGWRTVGVMRSQAQWEADSILIERIKQKAD